MLSDGGPMTVTLLWLWEIQLIMTGWPERSPVVFKNPVSWGGSVLELC